MASPSVTYTFVNGATADASQVNTNFTDVINALTDGSKSLTLDDVALNGKITIAEDDGAVYSLDCTGTNSPVRFQNGVIHLGTSGMNFPLCNITKTAQYVGGDDGLFFGLACFQATGGSAGQVYAGASPALFMDFSVGTGTGSYFTLGQYQSGGSGGDVTPDDILVWGCNGAGLKADLYSGTDNWVDYGSTSTLVGWASTTTLNIYYKRIGKIVFVSFSIAGVSDSTSASFTLPATHVPATGSTVYAPCFVRDNGTDSASPGVAYLAAGSDTVTLYKAHDSSGWTAANGKNVLGQFWYQLA